MTVPAEVGSTANRYQILGKLAAGGMAEIFLARGVNATGVERYCVLKRILRQRAGDAEFVRMFLDEARLAAQLQHPSIASVYDIGMLGDSYFFTMEYVHGETVRSLLQRAHQRKRPVPLACVLTVIAGAAAGLHHAHERNGNDGRPLGIVHRDVSPSNLMVSYEGNLKIVDFGVAKAADRDVETKAGMVKGKISYLSPEQCRGARVDRRSDLFSLGIVMWEMLTGDRLYRRSSNLESMTAIVREPPPPPSSRRSDVPRAIDDLVLRLLAKSVAERFQTARDVVEAVEDAAMRAGTILSTSAVSRLVHDLFGARPEPWLQVTSDGAADRRMLASRPVPDDPAPTTVDPVEVELAAVPDLHIASVDDEPGSAPVPPGGETMEPTPVAPPPAASAVPAPGPARSTGPPGERIALDTAATTSPVGLPTPTLLGPAVAPSLPPHAPAAPAAPAAPLALPLPPPSTDATPSSGFEALAALGSPPARSATEREAPRSLPRSRFVTLRLGRAARQTSTLPPPRDGATLTARLVPLVVLLALGGIAGVITGWFSTRGDQEPRAPTVAVVPTGPPAAALPRPADAGPDAKAEDTAAAPTDDKAGELADDTADDAAPESVPPAPGVGHPAAASPGRRASADPPAKHAPPEAARRHARPGRSIAQLYDDKDYAGVVRACSDGTPSADAAATCVRAACYRHKPALAQRWALVARSTSRAQLEADCKRAGNIDLQLHTLDCDADPLDCR